MTSNAASRESADPQPSVSILLLIKNELSFLKESFPILSRQDYTGKIEYIYVDSGSTDGTVEFMASQGIAAHPIAPMDFHHGKTRNLAASLARNDILVYLSGDAVPTCENWLSNLIAPFQDPRVGGVYGRQIALPTTSTMRTYAMEFEYPMEAQVRDLKTVDKPNLGMFRMSNANSAIRKEVWARFKFDETVIMSEDVGMCYNILTSGMQVHYLPDAAVIHCHDRSLWYEFQKAFDSAISLKRMGVLDNAALGSETGYGIQRVRREWKHWTAKNRYGYALKSMLISGLKWFGVQLGKRADSLPRFITSRISAGVEKMYE
jgi:rhamnosyltransferase